ncbi:MAG: molecular chaperone HtpG [Ruminococcaceae bacterium]|nr:molecular chaperone HtpG [Oscillospiraceae bacterium]
MEKKQFKTESQKLLDMMINSIYTHKEIFLREIISNASDAIDKLYYRSLTDDTVTLKRSDYKIEIEINKDKGQLVIRDNGCGMTKEELENNLGTIAKSGSFDFKKDNSEQKDVDIIGQFGVGFYSSFMVCKRVSVLSRAYGSDVAYRWESEGVEGYTIEEAAKAECGTEITLTLKDDEGEEKYSEYLSEYKIRYLIKKYSDYITYPIVMAMPEQRLKEGSEDEYETVYEKQTLNSQKPLWKKSQDEVTKEEYDGFYKDKFFDFESPLKVISQKSEGLTTFEALLFIPAHAPFDYYTKSFEKGLELYSSGVMITEKCKELLPDYFSFVRGVVDSADLTLNISRETLQHDRQLKVIAKAVEKKIKNELLKMQKDERENYEKLFNAFGSQLKYGMYEGYGANKENLKDLIMFHSSKEKKLVSFKEYIENMKENQGAIYYAPGETVDKILMLPQVEAVMEKGYEILLLTEDVDEFAIKMLHEYEGKEFKNVCADAIDLTSEDDKAEKEKENEKNKELLDFMKESIGDVFAVKLTNDLGSHPVSLSTEGEMSIEMEKVLSKMPGADKSMMKAQTVLEINMNHEILSKLKLLFINDKEKLGKYAKILYAQARLINGLDIENPSEYSRLVCELM